jgi:hypothetical protein
MRASILRAAIAGLLALGIVSACGVEDSSVPADTPGKDGGGGLGTGGGFPGGSGGAANGGTAGVAQGGTAGVPPQGGSAGVVQGGSGGIPPVVCANNCPLEFPQGVPDEQFIAAAAAKEDTDPAVDAAVNAVMAQLTGCGVLSDCDIVGFPGTTVDEICQSWFNAVTAELRAQGFCAGLHAVGVTDEIAVSNTCCEDKWYGYHICNYGGPKVVWNPGARRGWWMINPTYCGP